MKRNIVWTSRFKKDYKLSQKRGKDISKLDDAIMLLASVESLPAKFTDHFLVGDNYGYRECHIESDWVLVYMIIKKGETVMLIRTGTHSDIFG